MSRVVLSVGSNVGDRLGHLRGCVRGLGADVRAASAVYATEPWGGVAQHEFLNAVLLVEDEDAGPREWLRRAQQQEHLARRRRGVRWGPRTLDVDLITVDGLRCSDAELTLPHPHAHERGFVLVPWLAVQPDGVLPGRGAVADLVAGLAHAELASVTRRDDLDLGRR